jgi:hypothetical protein
MDILAMPDPDDMDDQLAVVYRIQDAIPTLADPIAFMAGQLLRTCRARIVSQRLDTPDDPATIRFGGELHLGAAEPGGGGEPGDCGGVVCSVLSDVAVADLWGMKIVYDPLLLVHFRHVRPPEE